MKWMYYKAIYNLLWKISSANNNIALYFSRKLRHMRELAFNRYLEYKYPNAYAVKGNTVRSEL